MTGHIKHPWESKGKYYVYNEHERIVGGPQRVITETDRNRLICPHCPRGTICLARIFIGKDLNIEESIPAGKLIVRCAGHEQKGELRDLMPGWNEDPIVTEFYIPLDYFERLP